MKRKIQYIVKYTSLNGDTPQLNDISTIETIKKVSASHGMILEVAGEFAIISNYNWKPVLLARRISYDKNS
jgi:hypothetical protein